MPVGPGSRLGTYDVLAPLGAGGMGEVYRARDTRLNREVALKVLPDFFAADPERLARFEREAQTLAGLNHPHIAAIYGFEESGGVRALVLELVEGDTLAELIARGPLPAAEALRIARQIADALEAAHEQGVVHRDLKPANVKVTPDGIVKVLDFGLAKLASTADVSGGTVTSLSMSPTMASPAALTGAMVLMGTAGYMAPEQARGKAVDKRADIWAFGVVLYEMLTGRGAFAGDTITEVAGAVIHTDPDWDSLPRSTPRFLQMVVRRCLQKDPKQRFRDMGDVRLALDGAFTVAETAAVSQGAVERRGFGLVPLVAGALAVALMAGVAVWLWARPQPADRTPMRFSVLPPAPDSLTPMVDISPDGRTISFIAVDAGRAPRLWIRPVDSAESTILAPSEQTRFPTIWSPDGRSLLMWADGKLKKVHLTGGPAETIADVKNFAGATWGSNGTIVYGAFGENSSSMLRVPATGGTPVEVFKSQGGAGVLPVMLPDGQHFLYLFVTTDPSRTGIYVRPVDTDPNEQPATRLVATAHSFRYVPGPDGGNGHLLFLRDGTIMAQEFDERTRTVTGEPIRLVDEPIETSAQLAAFGVSRNGTLVYRRTGASASTLSILDRAGMPVPMPDALKVQGRNPRVSPDGRRLAVIVDGQLWVYDFSGRPPIKLTVEGEYFSPLWTPDGSRIIVENNGAARSLEVVPADASGTSEATGPTGHWHAWGWSAGGREIVAVRVDLNPDLVRFGMAENATVEPVVATPATEGTAGHVSPDGRWIAYSADSTGRTEIWVRPLTGTGPPVRVSPDGGGDPIWARNGRELYYINDRTIMAVSVEPGATFNFKPPMPLFTATIDRRRQPPSYDVTPDGHFVMFRSPDTPDHPISVIVNWTELLSARAAPTH
jgi:Tol biopolymer transport system component/tRNA A-37 threonylcarbamoyl transferase component Bud32